MPLLDRLNYGAAQAARIGWYAGHYLLARRIAPPDGERTTARETGTDLSRHVRRAMRTLLQRELADIEAGLYRAPAAVDMPPSELIARSARFFADIRKVDARRRARSADEPFRAGEHPDLPRYYLQNFHFQTDGWLSDRSARLYDTQVETLFSGLADTMRRRALPAIGAALRGRARSAHVLDVACGTGRFLSEVKRNWPRVHATGIDLSAPYLKEAAAGLSAWSRVNLVEANAEAMPLDDRSVDAATAIFLFHELPRKVRPVVAAEIARVLKPGGTFVLVDSLQAGDDPALDPLIEAFPTVFHEPYYADYARSDLAALFGAAGLDVVSTELAFMSKVMVFRKAA